MAILLTICLSANAQTLTRVPPDELPQSGTFYFAQNGPPTPFDWLPDLPVYSFGRRMFMIDDTSLDYSAWRKHGSYESSKIMVMAIMTQPFSSKLGRRLRVNNATNVITMKKLISHISFLAIWLSTIHVVRAQGTVYVSNLGQTPTGSMAVGSDSWIAQGFSPAFDANQPSQYVLNSVQLLMDPMSGSPADFTVSLYSSYAGAPQNDLGTLSGPNPSTAGIFTYTASDIPLSESSYYFIVVTAASPIAQSAYVWSAANGVTVGSDNWYIDDTYYKSASGLSWTRNNRGDVFQMSISATAVPEPETCALLGSGLACVLFWPRRLNR